MRSSDWKKWIRNLFKRTSHQQRDEIKQLKQTIHLMREQLEDSINTNRRLLQDISHELRSPLARLQIAIELGRAKSDSTAAPTFERMESECHRLNELISELLDLARFDKGQIKLHKSWVNLSELITNITDDANFEFSRHSPRVIKGNMNVNAIFIDEPVLHRAIENVVRNALRYSPDNKPVTISVSEDNEAHNVVIDVRDCGEGVPQGQLSRIFDPFYRVDSAREKKTGGYGLGLSIAQEAIKLHDGTIEASNCPEGGFLVRITLPTAFF